MEAYVIPKNVRVRIAPSPTGLFHIGTARTALFNYLFARKYGGVFIFRVEDTDEERSERHFEDSIIDGMRWLGIEWDEGPGKDGDSAPYRQSERTHIYRDALQRLFTDSKVYYCFCAKEDLEAQRQYMLASGLAPKYAGTCSQLTDLEVEQKKKEGKPSVIRFRAPARILAFHDLIKGKIETDTGLIGDFIIAKNENEPLYNFAVAVDDAQMRITHVIRGEDHISNTPRQILLLEAMGYPVPVYGHVSLILGPDKSKMSKRHGATSVLEYKEQGYLAEALVNFTAFLGWNPGDEREMFSLEELVQEFDIRKVHTSNAVFNIQKLDWFNAQYIRRKSDDELAELCAQYLPSADKTLLRKVVALEKERLKRLSDIKELAEFFFVQPTYDSELLVWRKSTKADTIARLPFIKEALAGISENAFTAASVKEALTNLVSTYGNGDIYWPLRVALSGKEASPGPAEIAEVLGKTESIKRVQYAIDACTE